MRREELLHQIATFDRNNPLYQLGEMLDASFDHQARLQPTSALVTKEAVEFSACQMPIFWILEHVIRALRESHGSSFGLGLHKSYDVLMSGGGCNLSSGTPLTCQSWNQIS